jgi:hypothetical protein
MIKKGIILLAACVIICGVAGFVLADTVTIPNPLCIYGPSTPGSPCIQTFSDLIEQITTYLSGLVGSIAVLMYVYAGILFLVSAGNPARIESAKKTAIYATIGIVIALAADGLVLIVKAVIGA